ncbi:MAG: efflux RND transporter permease subunit, partial [Anaerolineae bacterium]|nr:efflux RND transporter permease subunit [Anaerolineae bacterium]
ADIKNTDAARSAETQFVIDRALARDLDLSPSDVAGTLRTALSGSTVGKFEPEVGNELDITLRLNEASRQDSTQLLQIPIKYIDGQPVSLDRIVDVDRSLAPALINRADRQRVLTVGSGVTAGFGAGDVTDAIEAAINEQIQFPVGYGYNVVGISEIQRESFAQLGQSIILAILLVYMLLVALFQSWLQPLAIMFSLPVALVGAFGGLWLTGNSLNFNSILGIIVLVGVVTKNAILIVDFTNNLRENEGYSRKEALVAAGKLRLRAIFMTTFTLVFALLPLLLGAGAGSENRAPLAAVVVGGVTTTTLLTLILVPIVYNFFDWSSGLLGRAYRFSAGIDDEPVDQPETGAEKPDDRDPARPPRPAAQPGSAITINPPAADPDTV